MVQYLKYVYIYCHLIKLFIRNKEILIVILWRVDIFILVNVFSSNFDAVGILIGST